MTTNTESIVINAIQTGNPERFDELYGVYADKIYRFIYYRTHHRELAEDLTSTTFVKALEKISTYDPERGVFSAWIYRIARNVIIDHHRVSRGTSDLAEADFLVGPDSVERQVESRLQIQAVEQYLSQLPPEARELIIMRVWDGLSFSEIAQILDKTEGSLKMAFARTLSKLRTQIPALALILSLFIF